VKTRSGRISIFLSAPKSTRATVDARAFRRGLRGVEKLHYGVEKEFDPAELAWLVDHGASPDTKDKSGVSARDRASRKRDKRWLDALGG
jgi:hypothetical protein